MREGGRIKYGMVFCFCQIFLSSIAGLSSKTSIILRNNAFSGGGGFPPPILVKEYFLCRQIVWRLTFHSSPFFLKVVWCHFCHTKSVYLVAYLLPNFIFCLFVTVFVNLSLVFFGKLKKQCAIGGSKVCLSRSFALCAGTLHFAQIFRDSATISKL